MPAQIPPLSRRRVLQSAAVAGTAAATMPSGAAQAAGQRVAVFGAGIAGLSAAHELIERGFAVTVYESSTHLGGKAWSIDVPGSASGGRSPLPGEHGFRFFPGFYKNLGDTMRRTPLPGGGTAYDQLTRASAYRSSFAGGRHDVVAPLSSPPVYNPDDFQGSVQAILTELFLIPPQEAAYFAAKLWTYTSSCDERRFGQWEHTAWKDFVREDQMSEEYRLVASRSLVRNLAATKSDEASTHAIGLVGLATAMSIFGRGNDQNATIDRVLDGPTSEVWLDHWVEYLQSRGVVFQMESSLTRLNVANGRISSATVSRAGASQTITAEHYIAAIPCEKLTPQITPAVLAAAPDLAGIAKLRTDWMNGVVLYLRERVDVVNGHVNYVHSPFALTSISQAQFWQRGLPEYGDGTVRESFSTIISDWITPGILYGKTAKECTPVELVNEVWAQLKAHLNDTGTEVLRDSMLHSSFIDPAIMNLGTPAVLNDMPLFIQQPSGWFDRPESVTGIPNLFVAGEWVKTKINVSTMDGANQGGRMAARGVLSAAGYWGSQPTVWGLLVPPELEPARQQDRMRWFAGQPNFYDPDQIVP